MHDSYYLFVQYSSSWLIRLYGILFGALLFLPSAIEF